MPNNLKCFEHFQTLFYGSLNRISQYASVFRALDHKSKKPQFSSETSWPLKTHNTEKHESGGQKICLYCDYRTKDLKSIKYHIDTKHPEHGPKKHFCNLCDKGFMFEGSLKFHMAQHKHKEKLKTITHVCDLCGKELSSLKTLEQHKLLYHPTTDVTEYMCEFCAFSTPSSKKLQIHKLSQHEFEKHKQCPHCDFKSPFNQKIRRHIDRQHPEHGEKQFFCDQCGKGQLISDWLFYCLEFFKKICSALEYKKWLHQKDKSTLW